MDISHPHCPSSESILQRRMVKKGNKVVAQVLVKWQSLAADEATWEFYNALLTRIPFFNPCGQGSLVGESVDTRNND